MSADEISCADPAGEITPTRNKTMNAEAIRRDLRLMANKQCSQSARKDRETASGIYLK